MWNKLRQDYINIENIGIYGHHGVLPEEKKEGQEFFVSCRLYYDMRMAGKQDDLEYALNYANCCNYMKKIFTEKSYDLIEAVGERICRKMLLHYPVLEEIELKLSKPHAPVGIPVENISVNLRRGWHRAYLSVGSNMGDRKAYLEEGIRQLEETAEIRKVRVSELIETEPYGFAEQEPFLNGAVELETIFEPDELLKRIHDIENDSGRVRKLRWGPRTLDLDIIFYDNLIYEDDRLIIPHVDMENRRFVLEPLAQLAPYLRHPLSGLTVEQLLGRLRDEGTVNK